MTTFTICFLSSRGISYQFASINESFWFSDSAVRCWHRSTLSFFLIVIGWASYSIFISFLTDEMFSIAFFFRNLRCEWQHFPTFSSYGVDSSLRFLVSFFYLATFQMDSGFYFGSDAIWFSYDRANIVSFNLLNNLYDVVRRFFCDCIVFSDDVCLLFHVPLFYVLTRTLFVSMRCNKRRHFPTWFSNVLLTGGWVGTDTFSRTWTW